MVVTGTFKDAEGNPFSGLSITFELDNFGSDMPRVQGSSVIVKFRLSAVTDTNGQISVSLIGNDTITPTGTYYRVTVSGLSESTLERDYLFSGASQDITNLTPEGAIPAAAPPVPSDTIDLAPTAQGDFEVLHSLGRVPVGVQFLMTSGIGIWFQSPTMFDATKLYLVASNAGTGKAIVW